MKTYIYILTGIFLICSGQKFSGQNSTVTPYTISGDEISNLYKVKVNGVSVNVSSYYGMHYTHLACTGEANIEVIASQTIQNWVISPKRLEIKPAAEGSHLIFKVNTNHPRRLILSINNLENLCILIDLPEQSPPHPGDPDVVNASKYLTDATGQNEQTKNFKNAIASVNGTGKTLYVPSGIYLTDGIQIRNCSDFKLYLAPGCMIRSLVNYAPNATLLYISDSENITIFGPGVLDHQAYQNITLPKNDHRKINGSVVQCTNSKNIIFNGISARNSRDWNFKLQEIDRLVVRNCKAISPPEVNPEWTDGFNTASCHDVLIEDCFAYCNDDCYAAGQYMKNSTRDQRNTVVRRMVGFNPRAEGVRLGWDTRYDQGDFTFEDCDFILPVSNDNAVIIHELLGEAEYGVIRFINCSFEYVASLENYAFLIGSPNRAWGGGISENGVRMKRFELRNVILDAEKSSYIKGNPNAPIQTLLISNLKIAGKVQTNIEGAGITVKNVSKIVFK